MRHDWDKKRFAPKSRMIRCQGAGRLRRQPKGAAYKKGALKKIVRGPVYDVLILGHSEEEMVGTAMLQAEQSHTTDLPIKDVRTLIEDAKNG